MTHSPMSQNRVRDALERKGDWMQTFTGRRFWPLDPRGEDVIIEDIAHALSLLTRYGGHCTRFYSVAEHSVLLARAASPQNALWLLLHDASEAYLSDMVRPLKRHMPEYRAAEDRVAWEVYTAFRLDPGMEPTEVKELDNRILMDERAQVMMPTGDTWNYGGARDPLGVTLQFWSPERAEYEFLALFSDLTGLAVDMRALTAPPASDAAGTEGEAYSDLTWDSPIELPAEAGRGLAGQIMDAAWPEFGGNNLPADFWAAFSLAVRFTLAAAPTAPAHTPSRPVDAGGVQGLDVAHITAWLRARARKETSKSRAHNLCCTAEALEREYAALATQAPDKAGAREGVESAIIDSMVHLQCALGWPPEEAHRAINEALANLSSALATQPTGTEASRPLGGEDTQRLRSSDQLRILAGYHQDKLPPGIGQELCDLADEWDDQVFDLAASPNPPQADSTGQGDGWSDLSPAEIVRRTRCEADTYDGKDDGFTTRAAIWRQCCDAILSKLAPPSQADAQTQEGGR